MSKIENLKKVLKENIKNTLLEHNGVKCEICIYILLW
uniref:Uncharacterized protein n=1 Tax=viral metagenome TaxID=1070528 RepID=A0A6C0E1B3_9ZZZZ